LFAGDEKLETKPKENPVEEKTSFIRLFPNPNDGNVTMEYSLSTGNDGRFVIRNPQGVEVANYILSAKNKIAWINNDMLDNGVYIYTIYEGESVIETGKIIIVK
ncbi:MAG: T9SS type A sorting domain-containing protein, partial [Bacteroidia bacterium]|nr:T9SS type A sorting domain-containing protein [Bacteroidia bacterium]